jgi:hypothetical protein
MLEPFRCLIRGMPYCQSKSRGKVGACDRWTGEIEQQERRSCHDLPLHFVSFV